MAPAFPAALGNGALREVFPDVFVTEGYFPVGPMHMLRTMVVIRSGSDLCVINSTRLDDKGMKDLDGLGQVKHIVKAATGHGMDDFFYHDRYPDAKMWALPGATWDSFTPKGADPLKATDLLTEDCLSSFGLKTYAMKTIEACTKPPNSREAYFVLKIKGGAPSVLLVTDCIQNYHQEDEKASPGIVASWIARKVMLLLGFKGRCEIVPMFVKTQSPDGKLGTLKSDYDAMLALDWDALIPAHGTVVMKGAKAAMQATLAAKQW